MPRHGRYAPPFRMPSPSPGRSTYVGERRAADSEFVLDARNGNKELRWSAPLKGLSRRLSSGPTKDIFHYKGSLVGISQWGGAGPRRGRWAPLPCGPCVWRSGMWAPTKSAACSRGIGARQREPEVLCASTRPAVVALVRN